MQSVSNKRCLRQTAESAVAKAAFVILPFTERKRKQKQTNKKEQKTNKNKEQKVRTKNKKLTN